MRGLKYDWLLIPNRQNLSRTPHGVRGLKSVNFDGANFAELRRTPHGVRGLKYTTDTEQVIWLIVAPLTGCVD